MHYRAASYKSQRSAFTETIRVRRCREDGLRDPPTPPEKQPRTAIESGNGENASTSKPMLWTFFDEIVKEHNSEGPGSTPTVEVVVPTCMNLYLKGKVIHLTTGSRSNHYGHYWQLWHANICLSPPPPPRPRFHLNDFSALQVKL